MYLELFELKDEETFLNEVMCASNGMKRVTFRLSFFSTSSQFESSDSIN